VPIGTAVHDRTLALCSSLNYREWSGYYAVSVYETHIEHEYNAIREKAALIDISPLYKYRISGQDAARFLDHIVTRDLRKAAVGQVVYTPWCDEHGKVIDDGTVQRLGETTFRMTAAEPNYRWLSLNTLGLDVAIEDVSTQVAALALQGPTSGKILMQAVQGADIRNLRYFRIVSGTIAGVPVEVSRTGYTGDLGYEIWIPWNDAGKVWDALMTTGRAYGIHPTGILALDVARIEAGLIMLDVEYTSAHHAPIAAHRYSPYEIGLGRLVNLNKPGFLGRSALAEAERRTPARLLAGLEIDWPDVERLYDSYGLTPQVAATASRAALPVFSGKTQIGRATSTTYSPTLKKFIALASLEPEYARTGTRLRYEMTVEAERRTVGARVVDMPFFNPARKTATPIA
jgi:aminomethyltransferase